MQQPSEPNTRFSKLVRAAAGLLGIPENEIVSATRSTDHLAFRRSCIAFLLYEMGFGRMEIAAAMSRSATWVDEALSAVRDRMGISAPFRLTMARMLDDIRLGSPVTARFRQIRAVIACQGGPASADALNTTAAMLTLADAIASQDEAEG